MATQSVLDEVCSTFQENLVALRASVEREMDKLGVEAKVIVNGDGTHVSVPVSPRTVTIEAVRVLAFNAERLRSEFDVYPMYHESGGVVPLTPMALPVVVKDGEVLRRLVSTIWWRGASDNERLAAIAVMIFQNQAGPKEVRQPAVQRYCFVATAIFGENAEEVAILREWRDDALSRSVTGRAFVRAYYQVGPSCAAIVQSDTVVRCLIRFRASCGLLPPVDETAV